jgi:anaerobic selenocysteine-containing dehydrogenase
VTTHQSFCRICIGVCGVIVEEVDGRAVTVRGDTAHPISAGYLCAKGRALPDLHAHDNRLDGPLVRTPQGTLAPAEWDDALAGLGARLNDLVGTYGRDAIGFFTGNGTYLDSAAYWASRRLQTRLATKHIYSNMSIDAAAKYRVGELMAGTYAITPHVDPAAKLIVMLGTNPVVSHGQTPMFENPVQRLRESTRNGEVWVIDPRTTETARLADRHLAIRPGTDYALLAYLVRSMLEHADLADLSSRTEHVAELASAVAPYTSERAADETGIAETDLIELLRAVRQAGRLAVVSGTGVTMSTGANAAEWLIWALLLVTDSFDRPGGMWVNPGYLARLDQREMLPAVPPSAHGSPTRPDIPRLLGEWPAAFVPAEIEAGNLRALIVLGANLVTCLPDTNRVREALSKLDLLVVLEVSHTETTALATHVLPVHAQLERPDVSVLNDLFNPIVSTQYTPAVLSQSTGRRSAWWTLAHIGQALGVTVLPAALDAETATDEQVLSYLVGGDTVENLRSAQVPWVTAPRPEHGWVDGRLPLGKWDLAPRQLVAQLASMQTPAPLVLTPRRQPKRMNGQTMRDSGKPEVLLHPDDANAAGVIDGELVDVVSGVGSIRLIARVTESTRPGAASLAHGWADANVNLLVDGQLVDPLTGMPCLSGTPISIYPATADARKLG